MFSFVVISLALVGPMPWIYWSAMTTRLLVGILTPAIRAMKFVLLAPRGAAWLPRTPSHRDARNARQRRTRTCAAGQPVYRKGVHLGSSRSSVKRICPPNVSVGGGSARFGGRVTRVIDPTTSIAEIADV